LIDEGEIKTFKQNEVITDLPPNYHQYEPNAIKCRVKNAHPNGERNTWSDEACMYFRSLLMRLKAFSLTSIQKTGSMTSFGGEAADEYEVDACFL
jgi:hypothetical protein